MFCNKDLYNNVCHPIIYEGRHFTLIWKHLHDSINFVRGEVLSDKTTLTPPFLLNCLYQAMRMSGHVYVCYGCQAMRVSGHVYCVLGVLIFPLPTILIFCFGIAPTWYYFLFPFYFITINILLQTIHKVSVNTEFIILFNINYHHDSYLVKQNFRSQLIMCFLLLIYADYPVI